MVSRFVTGNHVVASHVIKILWVRHSSVRIRFLEPMQDDAGDELCLDMARHGNSFCGRDCAVVVFDWGERVLSLRKLSCRGKPIFDEQP